MVLLLTSVPINHAARWSTPNDRSPEFQERLMRRGIRLIPRLAFSLVALAQISSAQRVVEPKASDADILYAHPGKLVKVKGFRLNLYCMGSGSPTIVFDSGWEDWAPAWSKVQPEVAKWTRACSYDRAGAGFSDPGPMPRTSVR